MKSTEHYNNLEKINFEYKINSSILLSTHTSFALDHFK